jgi:hypothetical protein
MKSGGPLIRGSAADIHAVSVSILTLPREWLPGVAVHAAGMLEDRRHPYEQFTSGGCRRIGRDARG